MSDPVGAFFDRLTRRPPERLLRKTSGSIRFELARIVRGEAKPLSAWLRNDITGDGRCRFVVLLERLFAVPPGARHPRALIAGGRERA